ncbi:MAG: outer membrane protein assembly factor BamD [Limnohabitans sp.]|jgi:outer membrane protein assembly factor BamD
MQSNRLSMVPASLVLATGLILAGCSNTPKDITVGWSPDKIYSQAREEADNGAWDKAIGLFEKLEGRAAGTVLAQQAQIDKAFAQYKTGDKVQAAATLDRFIRLHPTSPAVDYALYLKGLVNFNDNLGLLSFLTNQDLSERDQKAAKDSFESFRELTTRFPESKYTPEARQRMTYIVNSLAAYEVHVARYYASRGAHVAAINRAQQAISDYPGVPANEEALGILISSYNAMGMNALRDDAKRVLEKNFPKSAYLQGDGVKKSKSWWRFL